jgi:hypothetical protein
MFGEIQIVNKLLLWEEISNPSRALGHALTEIIFKICYTNLC